MSSAPNRASAIDGQIARWGKGLRSGKGNGQSKSTPMSGLITTLSGKRKKSREERVRERSSSSKGGHSCESWTSTFVGRDKEKRGTAGKELLSKELGTGRIHPGAKVRKSTQEKPASTVMNAKAQQIGADYWKKETTNDTGLFPTART